MPDAEKIRENRLRRMAERRGLRLEKSRRRDPQAIDYGAYRLVNPFTGFVVLGSTHFPYELNLDQVELELRDWCVTEPGEKPYVPDDVYYEAVAKMMRR